ncbi:hypothetical protein ACQQ2N_12160 [Dokdonella sp. MW10]|uniref:hypothetical protein n=1 Tax=Dokdonella sp. MW10 TaxID=2992926 RepID=UPI003F7E318F
MDWKWWREYGSTVPPGMELWTASGYAAKVFSLNAIATEDGGGVATAPGRIRHGGNSGFAAASLALHFGASRIVLLGYDMQLTGGRTHHHGDHRAGLGNPDADKLRTWCTRFAQLAAELPVGVEIVNATRATALECFPRRDLDACLSKPPAQRPGAAARVRARPRAAGLLGVRRDAEPAEAG